MAASAIQAAPSHPAANSYATVAEASTYFSDRLATSAWSAASSDEKAQSLMEATRRIDAFRFHLSKYRTNPEQPLEFPRSNANFATGGVDSGSTTTAVISALAGLEQYPDDFFNGWAIEVRTGANIYQLRSVTDFVASTGTLTFEAFGTALGSGDEVFLIEKIPLLVKWATFEIALWLLNGAEAAGDPDPGVKQHSIGKFSETFVDGHGVEVRMPRKAYAYLTKYISRVGSIA